MLSGGGRDCLVGGAGRDRLHGCTGNDLVITVGNMVDTIDCGYGRDVAIVDRLDRTRRCERVRLR